MDDVNNDVSVPLRAVAEHSELALELVPETVPPGALDEPVRWAHVSELHDPAPYLTGQELLLSAGVNLAPGREAVDAYVRGIAGAGVTALGFGVTPPLHSSLPPRLRHACARHRLPLLVVPPQTPFIAVSRAVSLTLDEARRHEQHRVDEAREALTRAATGELGEVTRELAGRLSAWVALVGATDEPVAERRAPRPLPRRVRDMLARLRAGQGIRSATTELADGTVVVAQPVSPQASAPYLLVVGRAARLSTTDRAIMAAGAALLGIATGAGAGAGRLGAAVTALLRGATPTDVLTGLLPSGDYRIVAGERLQGAADGGGEEAVDIELGRLRAGLATPLVRLEGRRFTAVCTVVPGRDVLDALGAGGWLVAVTGPLPADRLPHADAEVASLLARARARGEPVVAGGEAGVEDGLAGVVSHEAAAEFARRLLAPLRDRGAGSLLDTLHTWLACHGGWDRTAAALGVHRNSVRHRIRQAERALGLDLTDPDVRMRLWFALRWDTS
ncbi:PucR C-terminal helix-turn-helix domain-containing protein [Prauserella aidingensis]|uniref:PucR family transcriptional regulator n=1 Tax=Prauserella aidingensis TaxID=387890 RepID=UPI0020A5B160|nr:PucR family transcriptional regulator [Prauserella aidingensis]MCP2254642.1 PucR C-terminal helix-turn-helix domain-containing protein [Prauserella aidingensis]